MDRREFRVAVSIALCALTLLGAQSLAQDNSNPAAPAAQNSNTTPLSVQAASGSDHVPPRPGPNFPALQSYYPPEARRAGQEGGTVINFCVDANGRLIAPPTIFASSGNPALDQGALSLANAGNGLYVPGRDHGVVKNDDCSNFKIVFRLTHGGVPLLPNPTIPVIEGHIKVLLAEFGRKMGELKKGLEQPRDMAATEGIPAAAAEIRRSARAVDKALDQSVGLMANLLDDVENLGYDTSIPTKERATFVTLWVAERPREAAMFREVLNSSRAAVRSLDEWADYLSFSAAARNPGGPGEQVRELSTDPQSKQMQQLARDAIEKLQAVAKWLNHESPAEGARSN